MQPRRNQWLLVLIGLLAAALFASQLAAQEPIQCSNGPLSEEEVIKLVADGVSEKRMTEYVDTCGVSFSLTPEREKRLRAAKVSSAVIAAVTRKSAEKKKTVGLGGIPSATSGENPRQIKVSESVQEARIISQTPPAYPILARQARISGTVRLHAIVAEDGSVDELEVVSGPLLLLKAALDAASEWKYQPTLLNGEPVKVDTTVDVIFTLSPKETASSSTVAPPPRQPVNSIRVGSNVQSAKLVKQARPFYPPLARQARITGTVRLHAVIAKDGSVAQLEVISGHPLLLQAALDAARQWKYSPTLLFGEPVEVDTTIDVVFTLGN